MSDKKKNTYINFYDLKIWQKARDITKIIYPLTENDKFQKDWGLKDQIRRSTISISSNMAEGVSRGGKDQFKYFLRVAKGSSGELQSQLLIAKDLGYFKDEKQIQNIVEELFVIAKMISKLISKL